jgi:hypothetical protein
VKAGCNANQFPYGEARVAGHNSGGGGNPSLSCKCFKNLIDERLMFNTDHNSCFYAMRIAPRAESAPLANERNQVFMMTLGALLVQELVKCLV